MSPAAALVSLALRSVSLDASARGEVRGAVDTPSGVSGYGEGELDPRVAVALASPGQRLELVLAPRLLVLDDGTRAEPDALGRGSVAWQTQLSRSWTLGVREEAAAGRNDFSLVAPAPVAGAEPTRLETVPGQAILPYVYSQTAVRTELAPAPRLRVSAAASYLFTGGVGAEARALLPLQQGPGAGLQGWYQLSPLDELGVDGSGSMARFEPGPRAEVGQAAAGWRRRLSPSSNLQLLAGAGTYQTTADGAVLHSGWIPVFDVQLARRFHVQNNGLEGTLSARTGPFIDRVTGWTYGRWEARAGVGWDATREFRLAASVAGAAPVGAVPQGQSIALVDSAMTWKVDPVVQLTGGVRAGWTRGPVPFGDLAEVSAFFACTLLAEQVRQ